MLVLLLIILNFLSFGSTVVLPVGLFAITELVHDNHDAIVNPLFKRSDDDEEEEDWDEAWEEEGEDEGGEDEWEDEEEEEEEEEEGNETGTDGVKALATASMAGDTSNSNSAADDLLGDQRVVLMDVGPRQRVTFNPTSIDEPLAPIPPTLTTATVGEMTFGQSAKDNSLQKSPSEATTFSQNNQNDHSATNTANLPPDVLLALKKSPSSANPTPETMQGNPLDGQPGLVTGGIMGAPVPTNLRPIQF